MVGTRPALPRLGMQCLTPSAGIGTSNKRKQILGAWDVLISGSAVLPAGGERMAGTRRISTGAYFLRRKPRLVLCKNLETVLL